MSELEDLRGAIVSRIQECEERKKKREYLNLSALKGYINALMWVLQRIDFIMLSEE